MENEIQTDIKNQIKKELNLEEDIEDAELFELLRHARVAKHPDKFRDDDAKKKAEEEFKKFNDLFNKFRKYLDNKKASMSINDLAIYDDQIAEISRLDKLAIAEDEIFALKSKIKELEIDITSKDLEIEQLQQHNSILSAQQFKDNISGLDNIYKPKMRTKVAGIISLFVLVLSNIAIVKKYLTQIMTLSDDVLNWIFIIILSLSLLSIIYTYICNHRLKMLYSRFSSLSILKDINITEHRKKWGYGMDRYITETDIEEFISSKIEASIVDKILFISKRDIIQNELKNYVITELTTKKIATYGDPNMINRKFMLTSNE